MTAKPLYRVVFHSNGQVYELFAQSVSEGLMFGFVQIADLVFGERSDVLVDPAEEKLKAQFENVTRFHIPMHAVMRIDEVSKQGVAKVGQLEGGESKVTPFPVYPQSRPDR